jgi:hypothetical protein
LAKCKLDLAGFIKAHFDITNALERVKRVKSELEPAGSLAQIFRANKDEKVPQKKPLLLDHEEVRPGGCREASKATHGLSRSSRFRRSADFLSLDRDSPKNINMVVRTSAVLLEKKPPGVVSVIPAVRIAPQAATEADSDGDAEDDRNKSEILCYKFLWAR